MSAKILGLWQLFVTYLKEDKSWFIFNNMYNLYSLNILKEVLRKKLISHEKFRIFSQAMLFLLCILVLQSSVRFLCEFLYRMTFAGRKLGDYLEHVFCHADFILDYGNPGIMHPHDLESHSRACTYLWPASELEQVTVFCHVCLKCKD